MKNPADIKKLSETAEGLAYRKAIDDLTYSAEELEYKLHILKSRVFVKVYEYKLFLGLVHSDEEKDNYDSAKAELSSVDNVSVSSQTDVEDFIKQQVSEEL